MIILCAIFLPIIAGLILPFLKLNKTIRNIYILGAAVITSIINFVTAFIYNVVPTKLISITDTLYIGFNVDGLSKIFLMMLIVLWPLATLYAIEYMDHEEKQESFFRYYLIAYGIALGIGYSINLITLYLFYELLTFLTLPLIMHKIDEKKSLYAGKVYLVVSIFGASLALIGITIFTTFSQNIDFVYGGVLNVLNIDNNYILNITYLLFFIGFGVKAAIIPFTYWLPTCGVAPTPVSALLHAVAVVKAGVFAIMRVTYYSFGTNVLLDGFAVKVAMILSIVTILYGSIMAVKERHIKRRLAYSTASNLSYILFAILLLSEDGFAAGLSHMLFHAIIKINLFFVAGAIMIYANREYVTDLQGIAKKMPISMFAFLVSSLAMVGTPLTCGFISKYKIITASVESGSPLSILGIAAIIISAILTFIYLFGIVISAYVSEANTTAKRFDKIKEAKIPMRITFVIIMILIIYFGVNSTSLISFIESVARGLI